MDKKAETIHELMRKLIAISCDFPKRPPKEFREFHKLLLNFYFKSIDVNIDYSAKIISIWNSKPLTTDPVRLYDLNEAISDNVGYTNLEETLTGCLENGHFQNKFYLNLLLEFEDTLKNDGDSLSA